ncbi:MAG TPA: DUF2802 domain-containing protein [Steroidobacteraceae bacterium]|nr:DUF2802 domain-containing protein [Steroidobacteraceae bacterium]
MPVLSVETLFIAGRAVFLLFSFVVAAVSFTAWRRATRQQTEQVLTRSDTILRRLADIEARLDATRVSVGELGERLERTSTSATGAVAPGYQLAIRLAKGGASRDELMSGCGLSAQEAELVQRLHGATAAGRVQRSAPAQAVRA